MSHALLRRWLVCVVGRICSTQPMACRMWPSKAMFQAALRIVYTYTHTPPGTLQLEGPEIPFYLSIYLFKCLYGRIFLVYCLVQTLVSQSPNPAGSQESCVYVHNTLHEEVLYSDKVHFTSTATWWLADGFPGGLFTHSSQYIYVFIIYCQFARKRSDSQVCESVEH